MIILLSPAKKQDFETNYPDIEATQPLAKKDTSILVDTLKKLKQSQIGKLMGVSDKIAELNFERFKAFDPQKYNRNNAKQAIFAFKGDAYRALDVNTLDKPSLNFLQQHLRILSGLYGSLRPLDLIQPYRLEMKTPLTNPVGRDLYDFWGDKISKQLYKQLKEHKNQTFINLASSEYFKAVTNLPANIINITFKEKKGDQYKVIGIHAKRARGLMTRYIAHNQIDNPKKLIDFAEEKYRFNKKLSSDNDIVFTR